jgi:hypothetical protein
MADAIALSGGISWPLDAVRMRTLDAKETPRIKKVDLGNVNNDIRHCFAALAMTMELTQQLLGIAKVVSAKQSTRLERGASDLLQPRSCTHLVTGQATSKGSGTV